MNEMQMTEATQANSADASQTPADNNAYYGGDKGGQGQQEAPAVQEQPPQEAAKAGEKPGDQPPSILGAPESYDFKSEAVGKDVKFDDGVLGAFTDVAKELNLTQDAAQKVIDKVAPTIVQRQIEQVQAIQNEWAATAIADKEYGGSNLQENLSVAKKALDAFGTPALQELLNQSKLGNHPEVIRFMYRAGKAISTDKYVGPSQGAGAARSMPKDMAGYSSALYPNQSN